MNVRSLVAVVVILLLASQAFASAVYHVTGRVEGFEGQRIVLAGREYKVAKECRFERHFKRNNAFFVDKADSRDVRNGSSVILHINGTVVDQIMIEEWKQ